MEEDLELPPELVCGTLPFLRVPPFLPGGARGLAPAPNCVLWSSGQGSRLS